MFATAIKFFVTNKFSFGILSVVLLCGITAFATYKYTTSEPTVSINGTPINEVKATPTILNAQDDAITEVNEQKDDNWKIVEQSEIELKEEIKIVTSKYQARPDIVDKKVAEAQIKSIRDLHTTLFGVSEKIVLKTSLDRNNGEK